ncbi:MAG TPA: cytochrome D1 domain-containing protein [Granulicella sp.]|jgi:YVTN family beta-propeller protein|nr:cytochrome D1 domain-containing protein [Granulicella sp.]
MFYRMALAVVGLSLAMPRVSANTGGNNMLLVVEKGAQSLAIVDPASGHVVASVPEGGVTGHEVAASPDGRLAYVPIYGNSGVGKPGTDGRMMVVIDVAVHKVVGEVDFGHGVRPHFVTVGPRDGLLYVTTELDNTVTIVDPKTLQIVGSVPTGQAESHMLVLSHDGRRGYTANVGPGTVSVLDMEARKTLAIIPVSGSTQRIAISRDDRWVFTADQTQPRLAVIDTASNQVKRWIALPGTGYGGAATPDGRWFLLALPGAHKLAVIDLGTMQVARTIDVPATPQAVVVRPDGRRAYVSCDLSGQVAEIDLTDWTVARLIQTGKLADGMAWAGSR